MTTTANTTELELLAEQATWDVNAAIEAGREDWAAEVAASYDRRIAELEARQQRAA